MRVFSGLAQGLFSLVLAFALVGCGSNEKPAPGQTGLIPHSDSADSGAERLAEPEEPTAIPSEECKEGFHRKFLHLKFKMLDVAAKTAVYEMHKNPKEGSGLIQMSPEFGEAMAKERAKIKAEVEKFINENGGRDYACSDEHGHVWVMKNLAKDCDEL